MQIVYNGKNSRSLRIVYMFNELHITEDIQERRHYIPLIIGALQEHMVHLMVTLKALQEEKDIEEIEKDFDIHEMSNFTYKVHILIAALQEQDLHKKFVNRIFEELVLELEQVNDKIREIGARK